MAVTAGAKRSLAALLQALTVSTDRAVTPAAARPSEAMVHPKAARVDAPTALKKEYTQLESRGAREC